MSVRIGDYPKTADTAQNSLILFTLIEYFIVVNKTGLVFKFLIIAFLRGIKYNWSVLKKMISLMKRNFPLFVTLSSYASVNSSHAHPPPPLRLLQDIFPPCQSRGGGEICKFCPMKRVSRANRAGSLHISRPLT